MVPIVLVTKKDGSMLLCIDYRRLNDVTRKDAYPLPNINETLETLSRAEWFNTLDLASGYWRVPVAHADRAKTAFTTRKGLESDAIRIVKCASNLLSFNGVGSAGPTLATLLGLS